MSESLGNLSLQIYAIGPDRLIDLCIDAIVARSCRFYLRLRLRLRGNTAPGDDLLVLAQLHSFKDESRRADYFVREYCGGAQVVPPGREQG